MFNKRKYLISVILLLAISILIVGCGIGRDLSRPSTRLVGHWGIFEEDTGDLLLEVYFGEVDEDGIGSIYLRMIAEMAESDEDFIESAQYIVDSESEDIVTIITYVEGNQEPESSDLEVAEDGQTLKIEQFEFQYIDSKTEP